jgi:hypothetical protein
MQRMGERMAWHTMICGLGVDAQRDTLRLRAPGRATRLR